MQTSYATAEIWRLRRDGTVIVLEIHSRELDRWIELRLTRPQVWTMVSEMTVLAHR